jgi:hypothetical protein
MAMYSTAPSVPTENVLRGAIAALLIVPIGVTVWVLIGLTGWVVGFVSFGIAWGAFGLYRLGSGGIVGRRGAVVVTIVTLGTVCLAIFTNIVAQVAIGLGEGAGISALDAFFNDQFWPTFSFIIDQPDVQSELVPGILIGLAIGVLGCFSSLRNALRATAPQQAAAQAPAPYTPITPRNPEDNAS